MKASAEDLRRAFDDAFGAAPAEARDGGEDLLAVAAGGEIIAVRVRELRGIAVDRRIVPLPSRAVALLGVAGIDGALVPVFSLAHLLGHTARATARWIIVSATDEPVGLAIEGLHGHHRLPLGVGDVVELDGAPRRILEIPALVAALRARSTE